MIVKSSRVLAHQSSTIATYFGAAGDNERVSWLRGDAADIELMGLAASLSGKLFGVRHMVISPEQLLSRPELSSVLKEIAREYQIPRVSSAQACLVKHQKNRAGVSGCDTHYHLALPELDLTSGRVLSSRFTKVRDEKLARLLELKLHHRPIVGRFNNEVYDWLESNWPNLNLAPFRAALKAATAKAGLPPEAWKEVRARASVPKPQYPQHHWQAGTDGLEVTSPTNQMGHP